MLLCVIVLAAAAAMPQAPDFRPTDPARRPSDFRRPPPDFRKPPDSFRRQDFIPRRRPMRMPEGEGNYHLVIPKGDLAQEYGAGERLKLQTQAPCTSTVVPDSPDPNSQVEIYSSTPRTNKVTTDNEVLAELSPSSRLRVSTDPTELRMAVDVQQDAPRTNLNATLQDARKTNSKTLQNARTTNHQILQDTRTTNRTTHLKANATEDGSLRISKQNNSTHVRTQITEPVGAARPANGTEDKWIWGVMEGETTTLAGPDLDDRSAFEVSACPEGKARVRNMCVEVD